MTNPRDEVGSGPDENEPKSINIPGRSFAGASYGANADEQRDDRRGLNGPEAGDVADGGVSEELPNDDGR